MCQLTVLARLLFDRVLSYPGFLGECNFTGNVGLGRLHCLSDCVLSLCKSVCSYLVFASLTANASRIVGVCFMALSKPSTPIKDPLVAPGLRAAGSEPGSLVEVAGIEPASSAPLLSLLQGVSPLPRSCSRRADESPSVFSIEGGRRECRRAQASARF